MKSLRKTPKKQLLLIAAVVLLVYTGGIVLLDIFGKVGNFYWQAGLGISIFIFSYIITYRIFLSFIEKRINPIYKTIHKVTQSKYLRKKIDTGDISADLNYEVESWAKVQTKEIRQLKEMEQYRKDFLGNVSHELKTPIFNIQGYILTLLDGGINDKKINKLYLQRAENSINRMISIVDDLVSISRLESGEFKLDISSFNLVRLVEDVFESHEMIARKFKVKLEFDRHYTKSIKVKADRKRIMEVLNNLIANSIKYGKTNGKTKVGFTDNGDTILIDISDNGIGIAEEYLHRIFERFYRVDKSRSRDSGGTGLGLSIVKHIIQVHKQSINVRSNINKGTTFTFSLKKS